MIDSLDVMLWGNKVGTLVSTKKGYKNQICFYFDRDFITLGFDIAPLRASTKAPAAQNGMPIYPETDKMFGGLPSFIADSMPDRWGNTVFNEWAKAHNIRQKDLTALGRLAYIGRRGMGALEFVPPTNADIEKPFKVEIIQLSKLAQKALSEAKNFHTILSPDFAIESLFKVGTSAGGRRPKAVINLNSETGECYSGQVPTPMAGFTPMIIKFDEHGDVPTTRIEYSYYLMARAAGLNMMPSRLIETGDETHFLTERFDRRNDEKIHIQTLAAMCPNSNSYENLFDTAMKLNLSPKEMQHLYNQMVMNVVAANVDDHNKNFSFVMGKDGIWHSAPAYDFTFTVDTSAPHFINRHCLTINGENQNISRADLVAVAKRYNIKSADAIIDKSIGIVRNYRKFAAEANVPEEWIKKIEAEIDDRLERISTDR